MSVGDSAEEFISIHALGRELLLVLSCGLPSNPLKILFCARLETARVFVSVFYTPAAKYVFNRSLIGARHKLPTVEWALYIQQGGVRAPNVVMAVVDFVEVCAEHEITPRLIDDLLDKSLSRCWPRLPQEIVFFPESWVHRRLFRQSLAGIFGNFKLSAFHCHRSKNDGLGLAGVQDMPTWLY